MLGIFMPGGGNEEKIAGSLCPAWQTLKSSQHGGRNRCQLLHGPKVGIDNRTVLIIEYLTLCQALCSIFCMQPLI